MDFSQAPYFDDYDEKKKFYKILFRPGVAVQTREVNQLQTILQKQITRFGDHMFKDGSMVIPGEVRYNGKLNYIKLSGYALGSNSLSYLEGKDICATVNGTGVRGHVVKTITSNGVDPDTVIISYTSGDESNGNVGGKTFNAGQTLYLVDEPALTLTVLGGSTATGRSAVANVQKGVYYLNGYFVYVEEQTAVLGKYLTNIGNLSCKVGLQYTETIVTADDDSSLYDNASDTTNYTAPGAHRLAISADFVAYDLDAETTNFYELLRIERGIIQKLINASQYNILEDTLARRTYDESGNYVVENFKIDIREHRSNNRETWTGSTVYQVGDYITVNGVYFTCVRAGTSAVTQPTAFGTADETAVVTDGTVYWRYTRSPRNNRGVYKPENGGDSSNMVYAISGGKAYVMGYEVNRYQGAIITTNKARTTGTTVSQSFTPPNGNYIILDRNATWGLPDVRTGPQINLYDRIVGDTSAATKFGYGNKVGTARIKFIDNDYTGGIKLGLFDVKMEPNRNLERDVNSVAIIDSSAAIVTKNYVLSGRNVANPFSTTAACGVYRYTGAATTAVAMTATTITVPACTNSSVSFYLTSSGTFFTRSLASGDTIQVTTTSNSVSSFLVTTVVNDTTIAIRYTSGTGFATTGYLTSMSVVLPPYTIFGVGSTPALCHELRTGDSVFLSSASVYVSGTVTKIYSFSDTGDNRNRITISSSATAAQSISSFNVVASATVSTSVTTTSVVGYFGTSGTIQVGQYIFGTGLIGIGSSVVTNVFDTSVVLNTNVTLASGTAITFRSVGLDLYVQYSGQGVNFVGNILGKYSVGVNARRLTGQFSIRDVDGNTVLTPQQHQAVRIVAAGSDGRLLTEQLNVNDMISINGYNIFVNRRSDNLKVFGVCMDSVPQVSATNYPAFIIENNIQDAGKARLLFKIDDVPATITDNVYKTYKLENFAIGAATSVLTLTLNTGSNPAESWFTNAPLDYLVSVTDTTAITTQQSIYYVQPTGGNIQVYLSTSVTGNVRVIYPVLKTANAGTLGGVKTKTLVYDQSADLLSSSITQQTRIVLPHADVYRINKILMAKSFVTSWSTSVAATAIDITGNFQLDDGQQDAFYDYSALVLNPGAPQPYGSIRAYYDYFSHGSGDFFTKDSYSSTQVPYESIPDYKGEQLRDYLDFRPLFGTTSTLTNINVMRYGTVFTANSNRYQARKDKILLNRNAEFSIVSSAPAVNPADPKVSVSNDMMEVFDVNIAAYTDNTEWPDISYKVKENRRYTMSDIGKLETRISNLEETVTLSLLEIKTKSLQIRDNKDSTLERYKTGFFVDPFTDQTNADNVIDNRFTIDSENQTMQTHINSYGFPLTEKINYTAYSPSGNAGGAELTPINAARAIQNYQVTGELMTLPYTTSVAIKQMIATSSIAVCPFLTLTFLGQMKLYPDKDVYEDVTTIKINKEDVANKARYNEAVALGKRLYGSRYTVDTKSIKRVTETQIDKTLIPYCRPNTIAVVITGLKPNCKHYPMIDGLDIRKYVSGAIKFTMYYVDLLKFYHLRPSGSKDWARWRSLSYTKEVRKRVSKKISKTGWSYERVTLFPKDYDQYLPSSKYGDAFRQAYATGASVYYREGSVRGSGVAMLQDGNTLYIANGRGRLSPQYIRKQPANSYLYNGNWSIAGITGSYFTYLPTFLRTALQVCTDDADGNLYSDDKGNLVFTIDFPNNDLLSFFTGDKHIVVSDDPDDDPENWTSRADAYYKVEGYKVVITKTTTTTRTYKPRYVPPRDPVAQSFKIPDGYPDGMFITGISTYFKEVPPSDALPVVMELRTCDATGRPSPEEVPGTTLIKYASEISIDTSTAQRATTWVFDQPVHLKPDVNYAFVLKTDSPRYKVWIAVLGQGDVYDPTKSYTAQGTLGSMFKSQDNTLWSEDQTADLKFQIHRAVFNTSVTGVIHMVNQNIASASLPTNPFTFMHGSAKIRVDHPNHGLRDGDLVRFHSINYANLYSNSSGLKLAGIPVTSIFGTNIAEEQVNDTDLVLTVENATLDSYVVTADTIANIGDDATTGETLVSDGGRDIFANSQVLFNISTPQIPNLSFGSTQLNLTSYQLQGHTYDNLPVGGAAYTQITRNQDLNVPTVHTTAPRIILTDLNENLRYSGVSITAGTGTQFWYDSYIARIQMSSTNDAVSPAIGMNSAHLNVVQHRIDNPSFTTRLGGGTLPPYGTTSTFVVYKTVVSGSTTIAFNQATTSIVSTTSSFSQIVPGRYITVSGAANSGNNNVATGFMVMNVSQDGTTIFVSSNTIVDELPGSSVTIRQLQDFTEEATLVDATGESKYITRKINLENPATQLKVLFDQNCPAEANFQIYYKIGNAAQDFSLIPWDKYEQQTAIDKNNDRTVFTEYETNITSFDAGGFPIDLSPFTAFQLKIVMTSTNSARIPAFKNLRVIAHA